MHLFPTSPTSCDWCLEGKYWTVFTAAALSWCIVSGSDKPSGLCWPWDTMFWTTSCPSPAVLVCFPALVSALCSHGRNGRLVHTCNSVNNYHLFLCFCTYDNLSVSASLRGGDDWLPGQRTTYASFLCSALTSSVVCSRSAQFCSLYFSLLWRSLLYWALWA